MPILSYQQYLTKLTPEFSSDFEKGQIPSSIINKMQHYGVNETDLHRIFLGEDKLDKELALKISNALAFNQIEKEYFINLVEYHNALSEVEKSYHYSILESLIEASDKKTKTELSNEEFKIISDWYHFAILEMAKIEGLKLTPEVVQTNLGITEKESKEALQRLLQTQLLTFDEDGKLVKSSKIVETTKDIPSFYIRKHQHQMIEKSRWALEEQNIFEREISSMTIAINSEDIPEFKTLVQKFKQDVSRLFNLNKTKNKVYQLNIQFFSLTQNEEKKLRGNV